MLYFRGKIKSIPAITALLVCLCMLGGTGHAEDVKAMKGLNFQVPEDWPIEKRGGIVAPIPTEEYVAKKFKSVAEELQAVKGDLAAKFDDLQSSIKALESDFSRELKKVKSQEGGAVVVNQDMPVDSNQDLFKEGLESLDHKLAGQIQSLKIQLEQVNSKLTSLDKKVKEIQTQLYKVDEKVDFIGQK